MPESFETVVKDTIDKAFNEGWRSCIGAIRRYALAHPDKSISEVIDQAELFLLQTEKKEK